MKFKFILLLLSLSFIACKKNSNLDDLAESTEEVLKMPLLEHLNGDWHFINSIQDGNSGNIPIAIDSEIWKINGDDLNIVRKSTNKYTNVPTGKHTISIVEGDNDLIFLLIDEAAFSSIHLSENKLSLNTGSLPNESISHANTYIFEK